MNYLELYIDIFNSTTKWDRRARESKIYEWCECISPEFPSFDELSLSLEKDKHVNFGHEFQVSLLFPLLREEIKKDNLEAIRLLYDLNLDKKYMNFNGVDEPLFTIGLRIDPTDTQMLYEQFLYLSQLLESSLKDVETGIYYHNHIASIDELEELLKHRATYEVLCVKLRKNNMRTSSLLRETKEAFSNHLYK